MATRGVNKVIIVGNVGKDPDVRYFPSGDAVANFTVATSEVWKDKNTGEPQERTEWHRVTVRGKLAEVVKQYVHKGSKLYLEGKLQTRKWTGQDGQERYTTEVVVDLTGTMQMLDSRPAGSGTSAPYEAAAPRPAGGVRNGAPAAGGYDDFGGPGPAGGGSPGGPSGGPPMQDFDDDIPF